MSRRTNESLVDMGGCAPPVVAGAKRKEPVRNRVLIAGIIALFICVLVGLYAAGVWS